MANDLTSLGLSTLLGGAGTSVAAGEAAVAETLVSTEVSPFIAQPVDAFVSVPLLAPAKQDRDCFASLAVTMRSARRLNGHPGASGRLGETPASPRAIDLKNVKGWAEAACANYTGMDKTGRIRILNLALAHLCQTFNPENVTLGKSPTASNMKSALKAVLKESDIARPSDSDIDEYMEAFAEMVQLASQELGLIGVRESVKRTGPPKGKFKPETILRQAQAALSVLEESTALAVLFPKGETSDEAMKVATEVEGIAEILRTPGVAVLEEEQEIILEATEKVFEAAMVLNELYFRDLALDLDRTQADSILAEISSEADNLIAKNIASVAGISAETFKEVVRFYVEYWLASFRGNPPPVLTLSRKALDAAVFRVSKTVSDADRPVFEREARLVIYGLVTWERFKRPDEKTSSGRFQPTPIRHDEILRLMGEHSLWLEIFYEDLIRKKSLATANIFHQLVFKYIRYLYAMRRDRLNEQYLTDEGLEAEVVRLMLAQSDDKSLYSDDALHALREFFSTLSTKESPPLSDLKAVGRGVIEIASQTEKHFVPYKKGMGLGEWLETFPFDLSEKSQRDGFETTTGIRLQSVRKWGKVRDLKTLTDVVAHEPENHHVMLEVYYALDTLCQKHGMRVDIWDFMAAVFPAVGQMREAALLSPDGKTAEVVVRQPGVVENVAIHNQKYQRLAVGILKAGLPDRPSVIDQHASQGVQRPMWDTMEIIAAYISRHAGGGEEHQKQIYHYLILLRLIDVIPEVTEIRDLTDTVLSNHDRDIASCYQLRIIPEDEQFTYDAAEDEIAASARRWPVSDIKSGRFDRKLEILDGHLRALEFFGGDQKLTMPSGESVTVDALKAKLKDTFQQHNLFRSDLNTFDSPLKQEGSADYLKNLRKFYRELDVVFKQWLVMNRQPSVKAVGKISVQFMLVPKIGGITVGLMNGDTVFVAASDILELSEKEKWSEERTRAVFDVRLATAELKRQGNFSEENLRNIFETDVSEALSDYRRLELLSSSSKPTLDESHFIQVLLGREPRTVRSPKDYYVYVDEWRDDLRKAYRDLGLEAFIEEDLAACHQYFLKVRHPHRIYREDLLPLESVERLKHFFPFIGIQNETVAPLVVPKDKPSLEMLVEMALKEYIGSLPAAAELGAELPVIDMLLAEVVDFLLLENEHARGHRGQLIRGLKHAVAEHNKAHDRTSLERLKEKNPPLPLHGLLRKSLKADIVPKFFESGAYAVDEWLQRNFKKTHMIDAAALQRIATRYVSDRLLKILPHPLEDSILRETESLFGPYPKIRMMAVETYTILLNRYLHDLSGSLSEARTLILGEMADAATISVAKNRETFLKEVALRYYSHSDNAEAMYEEARAAEILAELLNQNVGETFDSEVERCWGMVVARTRTREEITEAEKREIEKIEREIGERRIEREIAWRVQVPALRAQVQAITLPDVLPTEPFVSEEVWRASREARDAYRDILKGTLKIMDAEDAALRLTQTALEKARADYDVWTIEFKETAISGELSQKEAAFEKLQSQANLLKIKIETDLQAISASRKADGQAVSLLAKAQAWVDLQTRFDTAEKEALAAVEAFSQSIDVLCSVPVAENPTLEEYLTLRKRYSAARNTAVEWLEECDRNEAALKPTLLHPLDDLKMQIAGLTESAIGAKEVLQKMQTLLEKISNETLIAGPISLDTLDEKAKAFLESVSDRVKPPPLDAPPPMPDLPTNPIRNRAGKMLGINYQLGVSAEVRTSIREAFEGTRLTLATFQTPQGFFVVDQMELFERFSPWMGEYNKPNPTLTLKLIDILGRRFILERDGYIFRSALVVPLDSQSAYGRMLHNYGHLTAEGGAQVVAVVNNIFRSGPSPKGTLLDQELSQLLAAFDPEKEVNVLESAVLTWAQSRWDMAVNIPQLKFFADLFPPTDPVQNPRKLTVAEADHIAQQMLAGVVLFEEMGLPVGEISPERWSSLLKRHTLVTEKVTDVSIRIAGLVADCRPQLGKLFEHLENRSPQLLQQILRYIPLQLGDALAEREKGETIDLAVVIYSAAAACRQFEAEIIYSDIWKHYRPYDWSQQYFDAGAFLYKELPKTPDHWGLRIVGWQRFKGKAFAVSESARNVILSGAKDPVGVTSFEAIDLETGETITVTPPEKITTDQFRWTEPYAQQIPNIWETLSQIYADPSMMVVAKIYEEAIYLARGRISPYPFLARQVYAHLFALKDPSLFKEIGIPDVRARLIEVYRRYAAKADKLELGDKAPLSAARESIDKIIPQPAPDADAEALQNYISRRQTLLNQYFFLGYDRRLDEAYEKLYTVVIASIAAQSRESILRNWLAFLEDAIRMQDVGGMLKEDEAKANSYARRYLKVVQLLETHLEEEGRTEEVEELRERVRSFVLSKLSFLEFESAKSMFKWIMAKPRVVPPSPLMPLKESVEALQLDEGYAAYLKSVLDDGVAAVLKDVSIKDVRTKAERILKINFKQNLRPLAGQLVHEMMTLRRANPQLSYSAVMTRILAKRYPGSEAFGAANQIIPTAIQTGLLHTPIPEVLEAQIAADFPDMCQGKLVYTEAAPETRDEELPEQGGVTSDQRLVTSGRGEGNLDAVLAGKAVPPKLAEHFDTLLLAAMAWYRLPLQEENIADMSRDKFYDTLPSYHDYIFEALSQISPAHHSEPLDYIYKIILEISGETLLEKFPPKSEKEMNIATRFYLELLKIYERFGHEFQFLEKFHPTEKFSLHYASLKKFKERDAEQKYSPEWVQAWWKMEKLFLQPLLDRIATDCKKEVDRLGVPYKNYVDFLMAEAKKAGLKERVYERLLVRRNFHLTYSNLPRVLGDGFAAFDEQSGDIHNGRKAQELDEARIRLIKHLAQKVSADKKAPHKEFLLQEFPELGWITPSPLVGEGRGEGSDYDAILTEAAKKVMALDDASGFVSKKPVGAELFIRMISENIEPSFEALRKIPPTHQSKAFQHTITGMSNMAEIFVQRLKTFSPAQKKNGEQFILKFLWACDKFGYEPDAAKLGPFKEWFEELKKGKAATSDAQREASANRLQELLETAGMIEHYGNGVIHENYLPFARDEEIKLGLSPKKMLGAKFHHHEGVIRRMNPYLPTMTARVTSYKLAKHNTRFAVTFKEYNDRIEEVYPLLLNHFKNGISQANQKKFAADLAIDFPELVWSKLISSPFLEEVAPDYDAILGSALEKVKDLALSAQHLKDEDLLMKNVLLTVDILFEALQKIPPSHQSTMREKVLDMLDTFAKTLAMKEGDKNRLNQFSLRLLWAYDRFGFEFDALNAGPLAGVYNDLKKAKASQPFSKEYENHLSDMVEKLHAMQLGIDEDLPSNKPFLNFIGRFAKNLFDAKDLRGGSVDTLVQLVGSVVGEGKMRAFMNYWPDTLCRWISLLNITAFEKMTPPVKREIVESYMFMRNALLRKIIADATADERAQFEKELDFCFPELVWADVFATNSGIIPSPLEGEGVRRTGEGSYDHLLDALATQLMPMSTDMKKHMSRGGSNDDFYRWMKDVDLYFDCFKQIPAGYRSAKLNEVMFESLDHFGYMLADGYSEYSNTRRKEINRFFLKLLWACDRFSMELEELPAQKKKWPLARAYAAWVVMKNEERFSSKWMERANFFAEELAKSGMLPFLFMQNGGWATNVEPLGDGAPTKKEDFAGYIRWLHSKVAEGSPSGDFLLKSSPSRVFRRAEPFVPESFLEFLHARKIGPQNVPAYRAWRSAFVADLQRGMSDEEIFTYQHDLTIDFPEWKEKMDQGLVTSDRGEGTLETRPQDKRLLDAQGVSIARLRKLESDGTPPQSGVMGKILALRRETPPDVVKIWGALEPAFQALWAIDPKYHSIQQEEALHLIDQQAQKILKHYERYEGDAKKAANELILRLLWAYDKFGYNFESAKAAPVREFFAHAKQVKGAVPHLKRWYEHCNSFENILGKAGIILEAGHAVDKGRIDPKDLFEWINRMVKRLSLTPISVERMVAFGAIASSQNYYPLSLLSFSPAWLLTFEGLEEREPTYEIGHARWQEADQAREAILKCLREDGLPNLSKEAMQYLAFVFPELVWEGKLEATFLDGGR